MTGSARHVVGVAVIAATIGVLSSGCTSRSTSGTHHPTSTTSIAPKPTGPASFALPATVDGLTLSKGSSTADLADATRQDLVAVVGDLAGSAVVGSYAGTGKDSAILIGLPLTVDDISARVDETFDALRSMDLYAIEDPKAYGGGAMRCANATVLGGTELHLGICVAADSRGEAILLRFTKNASATAAALSAIATDFEH